MKLKDDDRIILTLDAGGTNFVFSALQGLQSVVEPVRLPSQADNLDASLQNIISGFHQIIKKLDKKPAATSFAFPAPPDYKNGIIGDLANLPAYQGGVALGPMLEDKFSLPVLINNDGDLFAYGEAYGGYLDMINDLLEKQENPKRYHNLLGITLGTGFGAGIVSHGRLHEGDNSAPAEIFLLRNKLQPEWSVEEGASIRGIRRFYARQAGIDPGEAPSPLEIFNIATGKQAGPQEAAVLAYRRFGEVVGDALAQVITMLDGVIVLGGGLAGAYELFLPTLVEEMNRTYHSPNGFEIPRLVMKAFNLEDEFERKAFAEGSVTEISVPGSNRNVWYDAEKRTGVGVSKKDTSDSIAIGAYALAINYLNNL